MKRANISTSKKIRILNEYHGICCYCNEAPAEHVEHVLPVAYKQINSDDNLVAACGDCNRIAGSRVFDSFEQKRAYILSELQKPKWKKRRRAQATIFIVFPTQSNSEPKLTIKAAAKEAPKKQLKHKDEVQPSERKRILRSLRELIRLFDRDGKKQSCTYIAIRLSALAGLDKEHPWGWKYVASVDTGSVSPSTKFLRAVALLSQNINPRKSKTQWFYFAKRNRNVAMFRDGSIFQDMITRHMRELRFKPVSFSQYMQIKRRKPS